MDPRVRLGITWFRTLAMNTWKWINHFRAIVKEPSAASSPHSICLMVKTQAVCVHCFIHLCVSAPKHISHHFTPAGQHLDAWQAGKSSEEQHELLGTECSVRGHVNASWVELNRTGNQPYLERGGRLWVHLDHRCNQNHSGKLSGPLACCQDGDRAALDGNREGIRWFLFVCFLETGLWVVVLNIYWSLFPLNT